MENLTLNSSADIVCLSHLRWDFVYQRPNHLMARAARTHRVFFVEEPEQRGAAACLDIRLVDGVRVVRPVIPEGTSTTMVDVLMRDLIDELLTRERIDSPWLWYYTPMALRWSSDIESSVVVYDCMDELSNFKFAPPDLRELERHLLSRADVVFTGGRSLFEAKRNTHRNIHCFPSGVETSHFRQARSQGPEPADQAQIPTPRIGYYGVIDERIDLDLLGSIARARPDWQLVMVGPLAKLAAEDLPREANIHWLGAKAYNELPSYLAGWDVAMMPFALNDSTRYISPTKTPEYLCGGKPVVSTPIRDVVTPYGDEGLVAIAAGPKQFEAAIQDALTSDREALIERADPFLATQSWDATWAAMELLIADVRPHLHPVTRRRQAADVAGATVGSSVAPRPVVGATLSLASSGARPR
jgi:glycosyltransferase involved in cell wall biosynthesis